MGQTDSSGRIGYTRAVDVTVLVVDDDEATCSLVALGLEANGYQIVRASGGAEAVACFAHDYFDCVVLDAAMPDMDGFVACERIRSLVRGAETTVVFLTGHGDVDRSIARSEQAATISS